MEDEYPIDLVEILESQNKIPVKQSTKLPSYNIEGASGFGNSSYDRQFYPDAELNINEGMDLITLINEKRSIKQPNLIQASAGIARAATKALTEIAKMPGVAGGIIAGGIGQLDDLMSGEDNTDFIKTAFDNKWVQAINEINESINTEVLPVYVSKAVKEGNLWDNISSIDFWATEGADGVGYIAAMFAPGAAINRIGLGSKVIKGLAKTKFNDKVVKAANTLDEMGLPLSSKNIDLWSQTIANTLFEAGAEAQGAMESYKQELDSLLQSGQISRDEYEVRLEKQSEIGRNVFTSNAAILLGPNAIMSKMLWGRPRNKIAGKIVNESNELSKLENPSLLKKAKLWGDDFGKATLREGFFEEGLQSTAETYFTDNPDATLEDFIGDLPNAYADMITSVEGQKAILLGGLLGGGMQIVTGSLSRAKERKTTNNLIDLANSSLSDMYTVFNEDIYERKENGDIVYENDKPKINFKKAQEKLKSLDSMESLSALYDIAIENNDTQTLEQIKDLVTTNLIKSFIVNDELGIDVLKQHLEASKDIETISKRENQDRETYINDIISKAEKLQTDHNAFQNYANDLINLKGGTNTQKTDYYNKLSSQYLDSKSRQYYLEDKLKESEEKYNNLIKEKGIDLSILEGNGRLREDLKKDVRFNKVDKNIKDLKSSLESIKKVNNSFWDGGSIQKAFDKQLREEKIFNENIEKESEKFTKDIEDINNAKTEEEVNSVKSTNPVVQQRKKDRIQEIKDSQKRQEEEATESNEQYNQEQQQNEEDKREDFDYVVNNYNVEEVIDLPQSLGGGTATINEINKTNIVIEDSNGELRTITKNQFDDNNPESDYEVEDTSEPITELDTNNDKQEKHRKSDVGILTTKPTGESLFNGLEGAIDFERTPRDKRGESVEFEINKSDAVLKNSNWKKAIDMVEANDFSDKVFLINHLPINVKLNDSVSAPIETLSQKSDEYNNIFAKTSKILRKTIIEEMSLGNDISTITTEIVGQYNGQIQLEEQVLENNIVDLYEFAGDIKKIKSENLYVVDDNGILKNINDEYLNTKRRLAKGEIYLKIHMANGKPFPLKLNSKRINEDQAELLYELYNYRFQDITEGKNIKIKDIDKEIGDKVKELFSEELKLFAKNKRPFNDITIKDIIDFLIWDGTKSPKSQIRFYKGKLLVANEEYTYEQFSSESAKEDFIYTLTTQKRHNIKFKRRPGEGIESLNFQNRSYVEYLINNGILNTNAKVNEPTFAGNTKMYLGKDKVKVNGKSSKFNKVFDKKVQTGGIDINKLGIPTPNITTDNPLPKVDNPFTDEMLSKLGVDMPKSIDTDAFLTRQDLNILKSDSKPNTQEIENNRQKIISDTINAFKDDNLLGTGEPIKLKVRNTQENFVMTKDFYLVNIDQKLPVSNIDLILKYIDTYNSLTKLKNWKIDKNKVENIWKSRLNFVSSQKVVKKENMSEEDISENLKNLLTSYPVYSKQIMDVIDKVSNKPMSEKLQTVIDFLVSKNISREEIQTKCK